MTNQKGGVDTLQNAAQETTYDDSGGRPLWQKVIAAPFVVIAYPFMKLGQLMAGGSEKQSSRSGGSGQSSGSGYSRSSGPGAGSPSEPQTAPDPGAAPQVAGAGNAQAAPPPSGSPYQTPPMPPRATDPNVRAESARLNALERELSMQEGGAPTATARAVEPGEALPWQQPQATTGAPAPVVAPAPVASSPSPAPAGRPLTIAEELAGLQATITPRPRPEASARGRVGAPEPTGLADRVLDRDGNGRPDLWSYHDASGNPTRELLDENGDGTPDRTVWFEPATGAELRVEEDTNLDGRVDSWVEFKNGQVSRQRRDRDHDGQLDTWSFYEAGQLSRQEEDTTGDGFRNRVTFYAAGRLAREREDQNGDGRVDRLTLYDAKERPLRRDEDTDGDGRIDSRSIYEGGKLVRRELVEASVGDSEEDLNDTEWSSGPEEG